LRSSGALWLTGIVKRLTQEQLQARKDQAVRFIWDVKGDFERGEEVERESLADYGARRKIEVRNPIRRRITMARKTVEDYRDEVADLKDQIGDLEEENSGLQEQLDDISEILSPEEPEEENDE
jgi:predicted RNase H-like nuclease (RuvC/YqgF family)